MLQLIGHINTYMYRYPLQRTPIFLIHTCTISPIQIRHNGAEVSNFDRLTFSTDPPLLKSSVHLFDHSLKCSGDSVNFSLPMLIWRCRKLLEENIV
jgi:hypothetical protein